jgi:type III secretion system FlhB-like substrate exporter
VSAQDWISIVSVAAAAGSAVVATLQYLDSRRRSKTEAVRLAEQGERLRAALGGAVGALEVADQIVQRAKANDTTVAELQNIARALRQVLVQLAKQLDSEDRLVSNRIDQLTSSNPRAHPLPPGSP